MDLFVIVQLLMFVFWKSESANWSVETPCNLVQQFANKSIPVQSAGKWMIRYDALQNKSEKYHLYTKILMQNMRRQKILILYDNLQKHWSRITMCKKFVIVITKKEIRIRFGNLQNQNGLCMTACKNNLQKNSEGKGDKEGNFQKDHWYNNCNIKVIG